MNNNHEAVLELPGFCLDLVQSALTDAQGQPVPLRPQSAAVLQLLGQHANQLVSKQTLMQEIWTDSVVTDDSLVQCIKEIRRALGDSQHQIIQTLPKHGYKLVVHAHQEAAAEMPAANAPGLLAATSAPDLGGAATPADSRPPDRVALRPALVLAFLVALLLIGYLVSMQ
jgi:DNA-binding winged helix-turn-helix (wHTH) protein